MLIVPQNTPHMIVPDAGGALVLATLHLPRTGEPAPVPGRTPAAPKLINLAAELPAMIEKAKAAAADRAALLRRRHAADRLPPYRMGLEYRSPKGIASVHKNDGEFMYVLEGEGVIVTGGTVVNPKDTGANIDGDAIGRRLRHSHEEGRFHLRAQGPAASGAHGWYFRAGDAACAGPVIFLVIPA